MQEIGSATLRPQSPRASSTRIASTAGRPVELGDETWPTCRPAAATVDYRALRVGVAEVGHRAPGGQPALLGDLPALVGDVVISADNTATLVSGRYYSLSLGSVATGTGSCTFTLDGVMLAWWCGLVRCLFGRDW